MEFNLIVPPQIIFGCHSISCLPSKIKELKSENPLIVTSRGMLQRDFAMEIFSSLKSHEIAFQVYNQVNPEPSLSDAEDCLKFAEENRSDLIIGLGGGSVMDVSKKVAMDSDIPKIMIPTTAGTGSEVTHESVLKVGGKKKAFVDVKLNPDIVIVDPELTMGMKPRFTAMVGIDALAHSIECYDSRKANPLTKALAFQACMIIKDNLEKATHGDREAKINMSLGSLMTGIAFGNSGTTLAHALSYPLSNKGIPHGEAVAMMLPYALEFNGFDQNITQEIRKIIGNLGFYPKITGDIQEMAKVVMEDTKHLSNNPREVSLEDIVNIFRRARSESDNSSRR